MEELTKVGDGDEEKDGGREKDGKRGVRRMRTEAFHKRKEMFIRKVWKVDDPKVIVRFVDNMKPCSCGMCGNPRRHFGKLSFQEQRQKDDFQGQLEEVTEQCQMQ